MLEKLFAELGIPPDYGTATGLPRYLEVQDLVEVGPNLIGRMQHLTPRASVLWQRLQRAASKDGVTLLLVSGFRSVEYQAGLLRKKLETGQSMAEILKVNAAPGYSQHHSGEALDLATPGYRPLTEEFDQSDAFSWLLENGGRLGFSMSYPKDNSFGLVYEPWHWALN